MSKEETLIAMKESDSIMDNSESGFSSTEELLDNLEKDATSTDNDDLVKGKGSYNLLTRFVAIKYIGLKNWKIIKELCEKTIFSNKVMSPPDKSRGCILYVPNGEWNYWDDEYDENIVNPGDIIVFDTENRIVSDIFDNEDEFLEKYNKCND